jgi:hypothetical protein
MHGSCFTELIAFRGATETHQLSEDDTENEEPFTCTGAFTFTFGTTTV